jgi:hypothetical protein
MHLRSVTSKGCGKRCITATFSVSYLAMRCESRLKGRLWMKTTPGPVRDALSWLSPCVRWWFSEQGNQGILNTKTIMKTNSRQRRRIYSPRRLLFSAG